MSLEYIIINLVFIVVTFSMTNYCHMFECVLELVIPTIHKFYYKNGSVVDIMNI